MGILLYCGSGSPYAWRAQLALEHKALPYELKILSFAAGDTRKPEFLALAPWVTEDAPRAALRATAAQLAPGSNDALENDYLETAVWADLD